jgi:hypothetical protein
MKRRTWASHLAALLGYVCVAVAFSWPLLPNVTTHLTGDPGGDTGVYVWNQWVFQHGALAERRNPFSTEHIFSLTPRPVDLSQHNYTVFLNALALPLMGTLGPVATFNVVYLTIVVLTAWMAFVLARRVTGGAAIEAWLAGCAFAWAPALVARSTGHFSLVAAAPLAAFLWCLHRFDSSEKPREAVLAGLAIAWAMFCDPYYAVYCVLIATLYAASRVVRLDWRPTWRPFVGSWLLDAAIVLTAALVVGLAVGGGQRFTLFGLPFSVRGLYTPVLVLTALVVARVFVYLRPANATLELPSPRALRTVVAGAVAGALVLSPVLYGASVRVLDGTWVSPPIYWRSSPRGVDLLAFVTPNPTHPIMVWLFGQPQLAAPTVYVEYTASVSLIALAVVTFALWKAGLRAKWWVALTATFTALALGPFVHVAGLNTYVPGPWALLRYVPVFNMTRMPPRFAIVAALGLSVLFALALARLGLRFPRQRRTLLAVVGVLLAFELWSGPRVLYSAGVSSVYDVVRADPRPVRLLELPFGARDGVTSAGDFSARYQFQQTVHGKRLIGGYLSRVSSRRFKEIRQLPILAGLITLSEGKSLADDEEAALIDAAPRFLDRSNLGWVVIHPSRTPPALRDFAVRAFALEEVAADGDDVLYRPRPIRPSAR